MCWTRWIICGRGWRAPHTYLPHLPNRSSHRSDLSAAECISVCCISKANYFYYLLVSAAPNVYLGMQCTEENGAISGHGPIIVLQWDQFQVTRVRCIVSKSPCSCLTRYCVGVSYVAGHEAIYLPNLHTTQSPFYFRCFTSARWKQ